MPFPAPPSVRPLVAAWSPDEVPSPEAWLLTWKMPPKLPPSDRVDTKAIGPLVPVNAAFAAGAVAMNAPIGRAANPVASIARSSRRRAVPSRKRSRGEARGTSPFALPRPKTM